VSIIKSTLVGRLAVPSAQDVSVDGPNRPLEPNPPLVHSRVLPEFACGFERVDTDGLPPCALVAGAMDCAVMGAAQRYSEFVARPAAERPRLHVAKIMSVRWLTCERLLRGAPGAVDDKPLLFAIAATELPRAAASGK
jgi:hypothetical protein